MLRLADRPTTKQTPSSESSTEQERITSGERRSIHNETPKRLVLKGDGGRLMILAPLERTDPLKPSTLERFNLDPLIEKNLLRVVQIDDASQVRESVHSAVGFAALFVIVGLIFFRSSAKFYWHIGSAMWYWCPGLALLSIGFLLVYLNKNRLVYAAINTVTRFLWLIFIGMLGIGLPAAVIYLFGGCRELLNWSSPPLPLLGRILQAFFIPIAALLPALLYFLFDRQCLNTLRNRFEHSIFRLDPNLSTLTDVRAKYGRQADEVYGPEDKHNGRMPLNVGSHFPILTATLLITMGWLMTFFAPVDPKCKSLLALFVPQRNVLIFGFLGAYFFAVTDVLRRYIRRDLKPKAYSSICVRLLIVVILAWVLKEVVSAGSESGEPRWTTLALVFLVGIFPETGVTYIREALGPKMGKLFRSIGEQEADALTNIDGIDLYDRTRLMDEGVTNVESLAHHDLVDLMMETRIPVPRLVDWVDQAILYLHVKETAAKLQKELRKNGIRTATDLLRVYDLAQKRGCRKLNAMLETLSPTRDSKVNQLQLVIDSLSDDEWLEYVKNWRRNTRVQKQILLAETQSAWAYDCCLAAEPCYSMVASRGDGATNRHIPGDSAVGERLTN